MGLIFGRAFLGGSGLLSEFYGIFKTAKEVLMLHVCLLKSPKKNIVMLSSLS